MSSTAPEPPGAQVVLGVSGGIAAYKACELLRRLRDEGHDVTVVPTAAALNFVGAATWAALSGKSVSTSVWTGVEHVPHVQLGQQARLVIVAPATADLLARAATGRADDLLTNVLLTARCPVVYAPAMHTEMWQHPATQANVATLRSRGAVVVEPASGRLTGADTGPGRLPEPAELLAVAATVLRDPGRAASLAAQDLAGLTVAVSAGGTREHLDPVRYVGNSSSGLMGLALARAAALRGATVRLVAANTSLAPPPGVTAEAVTSTAELATAMTTAAEGADVVVMAAAPADFTPAQTQATKIKKTGDGGLELSLVQTPDVLAGLVARRSDPAQLIVGFAAETPTADQSLLGLGRAKLARKGCDLLVLNDVSHGGVFGRPDNEVVLLSADQVSPPIAGSKDFVAHAIWDFARERRSRR
jgi:phosphopantothenoylcysteine decarboxylase/phosphopantothenate--cysteine ligase